MRSILSVLAAALVGFLVYGIAVDNSAVTYYVPITLVLIGIIALLHRSVRFSTAVLAGLAAIAIGNMAGGVLLIGGDPLYETAVLGSLKYDKAYHAVATGVGAWASLEALVHWGGRPTAGLALAAMLMAGGAGALVEMVEYVGSQIIENDSIGGYDNNMLDLFANAAGAVVGSVWAYLAWRRGDPPARAPTGRPSESDDLPGMLS